MKFGEIPTSAAKGAILAHTLRAANTTFKKGRVLGESDLSELEAAGYDSIPAVTLEPDDVGEDEAASRLADRLATNASISLGTAGTGRVNLFAAERGLFLLSVDRLNEINMIDEAITVATIEPFSQVEPGQLIATVKIIPFAVSDDSLTRCETCARQDGGIVRVAAFTRKKTGLIQTVLPGFKKSLLEKGRSVTSARLAALGLSLDDDRVCGHSEDEIQSAITSLADAGCDILLLIGATAIADRRDVIPAALSAAGGEIIQFGMPVDPGNLTLLGRIDGSWVIGLPGSARSPRLHGSDWILHRLAAGNEVSKEDIRRMGAGGLLKESPERPLPRTEASPPATAEADRPKRIAAIVLAAGQSRRMGRRNKLLAMIDGRTMIARTVGAVLASRAENVVVVLGHQADEVRSSLSGMPVAFAENPDFADGLSTSLRRGLTTLSPEVDGVLICLGDMPRITEAEIDQLIQSFDPASGRAICVPTHDGKRGNPVLLARRFFPEIQEISGDIGARQLIGAYPDLVHEVEMTGDAILIDVDTPEALESLTG